MISTADLITTAIVPFAAALAIVLVCRLSGLGPKAAWPLGLALAYVTAQVAYQYFARGMGTAALERLWKPHLVHDWLLWAVAAALIVALVGAARSWRWPVVPVLALLVAAGLPARLLWQSIYVQTEWSTAATAVWLSSLAVAIWLLWMAFYTAQAAPDPRLRLGLVLVVTLATSVVLAMSGVLLYGLLTGAAAATLVGTVAVPVFRDDTDQLSSGFAAAGGVLAVLVGGLVALGYFFAELTGTNAVLLVAGLLLAVVKFPAAIESRPALRVAVRLIGCLEPTTVAVTLTANAFITAMAEEPMW